MRPFVLFASSILHPTREEENCKTRARGLTRVRDTGGVGHSYGWLAFLGVKEKKKKTKKRRKGLKSGNLLPPSKKHKWETKTNGGEIENEKKWSRKKGGEINLCHLCICHLGGNDNQSSFGEVLSVDMRIRVGPRGIFFLFFLGCWGCTRGDRHDTIVTWG